MPAKLAEAYIAITANTGALGPQLAAVRNNVNNTLAGTGTAAATATSGINQATVAMNGLGAAGLNAGNQVNTTLGTMTAGMAAFAKRTVQTFGVLAAGFALISAVKTVVSFDDTLVKVRANARLLGAEFDEQAKKIERAARDLGATTRFTATESAEALNQLVLGGLDVDRAIAALPDTLNLAAASGLELARSATIVVDNMAKFNDITEKSTNLVGDYLVSAQTMAQTTAGELSQAHLAAGSVVGANNVTFRDATAILTTLAKSGERGAQAGTALAIAFQKLLVPTSRARQAFVDAGLNLDDYIDGAGNISDPITLFNDMARSSMTAADMLEIFGARGRRMLGMFKVMRATMGKDGQNFLTKTADALSNDVGRAAKIAEARMNTLLGKTKELMSALQELAIAVLTPVVEGLLLLAIPIRELARGISKLNDLTGGFIGELVKVSLAAAGIVFILPKLLMLFNALRVAMFAFLMTNPLAPWIIGIAALVTAIKWMRNNWDKVPGPIKEGIATARDMFFQAAEAVKKFFVTVWNNLRPVREGLVAALWAPIEFFMSLIRENQALIGQWGQFFVDILMNLGATSNNVFVAIGEVFAGTIIKIWEGAKWVAESINSLWTFVFGESFPASLRRAFAFFVHWTTVILDTLSLLTTDWNLTWKLIKETFFLRFLQMKNMIMDFRDFASSMILGFVFGSVGAVKALAMNFIATVKEMWAGISAFGSGVKGVFKNIGATLRGKGKSIGKAFTDEFNKSIAASKGPEFKGVGEAFSDGFKDGRKAVQDFTKASGDARDRAIAASQKRIDDTIEAMQKARDDLRKQRMKKDVGEPEAEKIEKKVEKAVKKLRKAADEGIEIKAGFHGLEDLGRKIQEAILKDAEDKMEKDNHKHLGDMAGGIGRMEDLWAGIAKDGMKVKDIGLAEPA